MRYEANHKRPSLKLHRWPPPRGPKLVHAPAATVHLVKTRPTPHGRRTSFGRARVRKPRAHARTNTSAHFRCLSRQRLATTTAAHPCLSPQSPVLLLYPPSSRHLRPPKGFGVAARRPPTPTYKGRLVSNTRFDREPCARPYSEGGGWLTVGSETLPPRATERGRRALPSDHRPLTACYRTVHLGDRQCGARAHTRALRAARDKDNKATGRV